MSLIPHEGQIFRDPLFNEPMRVENIHANDDGTWVIGLVGMQSRVRFLLADDAGAGKTIMAGLLLRELQLRGLAERILVICPSNLSFQRSCETK